MILLLHASEPVGHDYHGKGTTTPEKVVRFLAVAPDVPIVLAHWGGGLLFYELMPEIEALAQSAYYDTAATPYLYAPHVYEIGSQLCASRLLFGSDYPLMPQRRALEHVNKARLNAAERRALLWENGARLLGLT